MVAAWTSLPELLDRHDGQDEDEAPVDLGPLAALMERIEAARPDWQYDAACRGEDVRRWFPERGEPSAPAKAVCETCTVARRCFEFSLAAPGSRLVGIWGGVSERQRRQLAVAADTAA